MIRAVFINFPENTFRVRYQNSIHCTGDRLIDLNNYHYIRCMFKQFGILAILKNPCLPACVIGFSLLSSCHSVKKATDMGKDGFVQIFNGKTLENWIGDSSYWSAQDNCLVGTVTPETILKRNTFIIYMGTVPDDFELILEYQISDKGNSGINYRSERMDDAPYALKGYQADLNGANTYTGSNYEERKRTTLASQGEKTVLPAIQLSPDSIQTQIKGNQWAPKIVVEKLGAIADLRAAIKSDWNEYKIIAKGNHLQHYVNGVLMSDVTDNDTVNRKFSGLLGVQVHVGPPMRIAYRNIRLKGL
jgi:hypothetical protein